MILHWSQYRSPLLLQWSGPNKITSEALSTLTEVLPKMAVVTGPRGPKGDTVYVGGGSDARFEWSPTEALTSWMINHPLEKFPSVTTIDGAGRVVHGDITYLSTNLVEVAFGYPTSGTAYLN